MTDTREQITNEAELDALPVGSIVARLHYDGRGNSVYTLTDEGWRAATEHLEPSPGPKYDQDDELMAPLEVIYRPDQPQRSVEDVAQVIGQGIGWPWTDATSKFLIQSAEAVLTLFAAAPTVAEAKAEAWDGGEPVAVSAVCVTATDEGHRAGIAQAIAAIKAGVRR